MKIKIFDYSILENKYNDIYYYIFFIFFILFDSNNLYIFLNEFNI